MKTVLEGKAPWWVLALVIGVCLVGIVDRDLWTPDEPRVAAISVEMVRTGNLVVPVLAGEPFLEKPPMYFAVAGVAERAMGWAVGSVGAIRLTTALWGIGVLALTFLLARRLGAGGLALPTVLLLGTSAGFVENMHFIRVDAALAFFVMAALTCFGEVFLADRKWFCVPAGLCTAGAFLSKGAIGLVFIAIGWAALAFPRWGLQIREKRKLKLYIFPHLLALVALLLAAGIWVVLLRRIGGEALWNEWFWDNQVGRLFGKVPTFGHCHPGAWWYYIQSVALYTLPWVPLLLVGFWRIGREGIVACRARSCREWLLSPGFFALAWGVGSAVVLTISVTKREMYLLPILPAFAMICAEGLRDPMPRWCVGFYRFWLWLCAVVLLLVTLTPLILAFVPNTLLEEVPSFLMSWSLRHTLAGIACVVVIRLARRSRLPLDLRVIAASALLFIVFFLIPGEAVDQQKSMGAAYRAFAEEIPAEVRPRIAVWNFSETTRGGLAFYGNLSISNRVEDAQMLSIVAGQDPDFDSVILSWKKDLSELVLPPYRILAEGRPGYGHRARPLYWIVGAKKE